MVLRSLCLQHSFWLGSRPPSKVSPTGHQHTMDNALVVYHTPSEGGMSLWKAAPQLLKEALE